MKEIELRLTIDEANLILEALGNLPFIKVYALIGKIQDQAGHQLSAQSQSNGADKAEYSTPVIKE
jgi:hypothetical protein